MSTVMTIGQAAMSSASSRAAKAANDIVEASNERPVEAPEAENPQHTAGPPVLAPSRAELDGADQYLKGMLDLKLAKHAYAAAAAIVRTGDEISEETLRIV